MGLRLGSRSKFQQPFDPITAILFKMIQALTFFFVLAVMFMNPVAKKGIIDPKAEYIITLSWPDNSMEDIDLWVEDPDGNLIWFRNREVGLVHLDRDDRGMLNDELTVNGRKVANPLNQEIATIRGIVPGEYVVNVVYYATSKLDNDGKIIEDSTPDGGKPMDAMVRVDRVNPVLKVVYYDKVPLTKVSDEKTALRFTVDADGEVVNVDHTQKSIAITRN
ncbi:MAG: hypothetical protein IPG43_23960 [Proteobacteria bacterium]|nr:hypothetical protein [Pseudomonadota bacterium]